MPAEVRLGKRVGSVSEQPSTIDAKSLAGLRREIDAIDDALHDLIMRRASVTDAIAATKPRTDGRIPLSLAMRPAREAEIMRRVIARHKGSPPVATVVRVVREILAASLRAQVPYRVHVFGGAPEFAELAHAYFGAETPLMRYETVARTLHACGDDADSIAVVPLAETGSDTWWTRLAPAGNAGPRVVAKIPFVPGESKAPAAYALAAIEQEATGDDTTMLLAQVEAELSRTRLLSQLKDAGIAARVVGGAAAEKRALAPVLLEAEGFVERSNPRLLEFAAQTGSIAHPVGGFANPAKAGDAS
jgi:chorismate mutase / prephenate dehydratase